MVQLGITAGALSSLAATDNSLNSLCARCVPGLVNMLEHGEIEMKEEAAHALKYFRCSCSKTAKRDTAS